VFGVGRSGEEWGRVGKSGETKNEGVVDSVDRSEGETSPGCMGYRIDIQVSYIQGRKKKSRRVSRLTQNKIIHQEAIKFKQ